MTRMLSKAHGNVQSPNVVLVRIYISDFVQMANLETTLSERIYMYSVKNQMCEKLLALKRLAVGVKSS